jgi:uncharacterized membrane protein
MSFLFLMMAPSALAYIPQFFLGDRQDCRMAMRHGTAGAFTFTGIDHFVSSHSRYVPMRPDFLADYAVELVYFTGATELAGAIGLVTPLAAYRRLGMPNLRKCAGTGLAVMFAVPVVVNINVDLGGSRVQGFEIGVWHYYPRPFFQPIFMLWAPFVSGVIWKPVAGD